MQQAMKDTLSEHGEQITNQQINTNANFAVCGVKGTPILPSYI
jgi:hypothetical protein